MPTIWNDCPVAEVLSLILRAAAGEDKVTCRDSQVPSSCNSHFRVASYREDFSYLWGVAEHKTNGFLDICTTVTGEQNLVLIWDGLPEDPGVTSSIINVEDQLTTFDWIVALSARAKELLTPTRRKARPKLRIFVLDLASGSHSSAFGCQMIPLLVNKMPWVRVYQPVATASRRTGKTIDGTLTSSGSTDAFDACATPGDFETEALLNDLLSVERCALGMPALGDHNAFAESAALLRDLWANQLTGGEGRHSVSNIVGVRALLAGMGIEIANTGTAGDNTTFAALENLMTALGLAPEPKKKASRRTKEPAEDEGTVNEYAAPWFDSETWHDHVDSFVLVDDMHDLGWREFVKAALGCEDVAISACDRPDESGFGPERVEPLANLLVDEDGQLRFNCERDGDLTLCGTNKHEILLLDLRLFANRKKEEEFQFLSQLFDLARQAPEGREDLPWSGFLEDDFNAVQNCIKNEERDTENYFVALTLLPRLISLVAPWLPIVLFSSTGQRKIVERLKPYGNVITDFEKPRFLGHSSTEVVAETKAKFERAMEKAIELARGRRVCLNVVAKDQRTPTSKRLLAGSTPDSEGEKTYVELYLDESGNPVTGEEFSVGGLAVVYPNESAAAAFSTKLADKGWVWGWHMDDPFGNKPNEFLPKRPEQQGDARLSSGQRPLDKQRMKHVLAGIGSLATESGYRVGAITVTVRPGSAASSSWQGPDSLYRALVRDVIELFLFEWVPRNVDIDTAQCAVHVATRVFTDDAIRASKQFGLGIFETDADPTQGQAALVFQGSVKDVWAALGNNSGIAFGRGKDQTPSVFVEVADVGDAMCTTLKHMGARDARRLYAYSFSFDDVHPILTDIYRSRSVGGAKLKEESVLGRGVGLRYYEKEPRTRVPHEMPRQFHFAADWTVSYWGLVPNEWKEAGCHEYCNQHFGHLVRACRCSSVIGRGVDAVVEWALARDGVPGELDRWATERVAHCVGALTGSEFVELSHVLSKMPRRSRRRRGIIKALVPEKRFGFISTDGPDIFFSTKNVKNARPDKIQVSHVVEYELDDDQGGSGKAPPASGVWVV